MFECKRKFERVNLPLVVFFRPTYGATRFITGQMKNISSAGLAVEAEDFSFIKYESLELNLQYPPSNDSISLSGSVIWKKQNDDKCMAGIKFKNVDMKSWNHLLESISSFGNIPFDRLLFDKKAEHEMKNKVKIEDKGMVQSSRKKKRSSKKARKQGFTKQYFNGGSKCKVTFRLPMEAAPDAKKVTIVGDFNDWNTSNTPMKQVTRGDYLVTLELQSNREYRFKYLIDNSRWENDWCADEYCANEHGSDDSVVKV